MECTASAKSLGCGDVKRIRISGSTCVSAVAAAAAVARVAMALHQCVRVTAYVLMITPPNSLYSSNC
eukprot:3392-Heterococcus_DN1.PRE.1